MEKWETLELHDAPTMPQKADAVCENKRLIKTQMMK